MTRSLAGSSALLFLAAALIAGLAPFAEREWAARAMTRAVVAFPGWPTEHEGRALTPLPMSAREAAFAAGFPGRVARFSDGQREVIVRYVAAPTRLLHPAADCLRAVGYAITPLPSRLSSMGQPMGCLRATKSGMALRVCEQVRETGGKTWPDASSWYWSAMTGSSAGPWWAYVVAEREQAEGSAGAQSMR